MADYYKNLYEFALYAEEVLSNPMLPASSFSRIFLEIKSECWRKFNKGIVCSSSHGIDYFKNIIKFWENPYSYYQLKKPNGEIDTTVKDYTQERKGDFTDYEYNFVRFLLLNKLD